MKGAKKVFFSALRFMIFGYFISGILLLLLALVLYKWNISQTAVSIGIIAIYVISVFLMGLVAGKVVKQRKFIWGLALGGIYFCILACVSFAIAWGNPHNYGDFLTTLLLCLGSGMLGGMLA